MRKFILRTMMLLSILNVIFCFESISEMGILITVINTILAGSLSAAIIGIIINLDEKQENSWMVDFSLFLINLFTLSFRLKFGLIMFILSVILNIKGSFKTKQDC